MGRRAPQFTCVPRLLSTHPVVPGLAASPLQPHRPACGPVSHACPGNLGEKPWIPPFPPSAAV